MKKILITALLFILLIYYVSNDDNFTYASSDDYTSFTSITLSSGKLIKNYTDEELSPYYKRIKKKKFMGYRVELINKEVKCNFVSETIFSIYNTGSTAIKYDFTKIVDKVSKISVSAGGSLETKSKGNVKKLTPDLNKKLSINVDVELKIEVKTTETFSIDIDSNTRAVLYYAGTGYLTNGVARCFSFWRTVEKGPFEYFKIIDLYPRVEKVAI